MSSRDSSTSDVFATELGRPVFIPDETEGYKRGKLSDFRADSLRIELPDGRVVDCAHDDVLPAEEDETKDVDDSCKFLKPSLSLPKALFQVR